MIRCAEPGKVRLYPPPRSITSPLLLQPPPSMLQASVINVLTCIIDAWHYDNGFESTHGEGRGVRVVWVRLFEERVMQEIMGWGVRGVTVWLDWWRQFVHFLKDIIKPKWTSDTTNFRRIHLKWHGLRFFPFVSVSLSMCLSLLISVLISASSERSPRLVGQWRSPKTWYTMRQHNHPSVSYHTQFSCVWAEIKI